MFLAIRAVILLELVKFDSKICHAILSGGGYCNCLKLSIFEILVVVQLYIAEIRTIFVTFIVLLG